jgi:hypothetical protein
MSSNRLTRPTTSVPRPVLTAREAAKAPTVSRRTLGELTAHGEVRAALPSLPSAGDPLCHSGSLDSAHPRCAA